jgi:hypothetical protein
MNFLIADKAGFIEGRAHVTSDTENVFSLVERAPSRATPLVCLNFKIPLRIRQEFKACAARRNMTMTELLLQLLDECLESGENNN